MSNNPPPSLPVPDRIIEPVLLPLRLGDSPQTWTLGYFLFGNDRWIAAYLGDLNEADPIKLRIESACIFGHVFHSAKCDCEYQLNSALGTIERRGRGIVIFAVDQDARGLGIEAHFTIYFMRQQANLDTDEVYKRLNAPVDARSYEPVATILKHYGIQSIELLSNNRRRAQFLESHGFEVSITPLEAPLDIYNMSTLMLEKEDLEYTWSFRTHADWLRPLMAKVDGSCSKRGYQLVSSTMQSLIEGVTDSWNVAEQLILRLGDQPINTCDSVVYLTDLPRIDELGLYSRLGIPIIVVPFPLIPDWLKRAASNANMHIQDWERRNRYTTPRPQWELAGSNGHTDIYRLNERLRIVSKDDRNRYVPFPVILAGEVGANACWVEVALDWIRGNTPGSGSFLPIPH